MSSRQHRNVIGVEGIVQIGDGIVLVRLGYSRHKGLFMFAGVQIGRGEAF